IPDYDVLMKQRLRILDEHGYGLPDIQAVIDEMGPIEGAPEFVDWLREQFQVIILSDTFYEFAKPLMRQLGWPTLFCHKLEVNGEGRITDYKLRQKDPKRMSVKALHDLQNRVIAAGDSSNDATRLPEADAAPLFKARQKVPKRRSVKALGELQYRVIAAGDSYNDTTMLAGADAGILFHAPQNVIDEFPQFPAVHTYEDLKQEIIKASVRDITL